MNFDEVKRGEHTRGCSPFDIIGNCNADSNQILTFQLLIPPMQALLDTVEYNILDLYRYLWYDLNVQKGEYV